jgi:hypothetical protein
MRSRNTRSVRALVLGALAGLALVIGGCGFGSATPAASGASPATGAGNGQPAAGAGAGKAASCSLAPASMVSSAIGKQLAEPKSIPHQAGAAVQCEYMQPGDTTPLPVVTILFQTGASAALLRESKNSFDQNSLTKGHTAIADVPGIGDGAFSATVDAGLISESSTFGVLKGTTMVTIIAPGPATNEETLARKILASL